MICNILHIDVLFYYVIMSNSNYETRHHEEIPVFVLFLLYFF